MSAERVELVGGPLDGHTIPRKAGRFAWVAGRTVSVPPGTDVAPEVLGGALARQGGGAGTKPSNGRALYGTDGLYAGHRTTFCNDCGSYHAKVEGGSEKQRCPLTAEPSA